MKIVIFFVGLFASVAVLGFTTGAGCQMSWCTGNPCFNSSTCGIDCVCAGNFGEVGRCVGGK